MTKTYHLLIHGRVQGVGYRAWMVSRAREHGLNGWVRNRQDGTVEAVIAGKDAAVDVMVAECYNGPMAAKVIEIVATYCTEEVAIGFVTRDTF